MKYLRLNPIIIINELMKYSVLFEKDEMEIAPMQMNHLDRQFTNINSPYKDLIPAVHVELRYRLR